MTRGERPPSDPWGEFLRRILLSAGLAGVAGLAPAAEQTPGRNTGPVESEAPAEARPGERPGR